VQYRWIAWLACGLFLAISGYQSPHLLQPLLIGLFFLTGFINVVLTVLAQAYVRLARQIPALLALDLVASVALLWLSNGNALLFLAYALGSLVLPALLFHWRAALAAGVAFVALDQAALYLLSNHSLAPPLILVRAAMPLIFVLFGLFIGTIREYVYVGLPATAARLGQPFAWLGHWLRQRLPRGAAQHPYANVQHLSVFDTLSPDPFADLDDPRPNSSTSLPAPIRDQSYEQRAIAPPECDSPDLRLPTLTPTPPPQSYHKDRRTMPPLQSDLSTALDQLVQDMRHRSNVAIAMEVKGARQQIKPVQYSTLFRLAQEALTNIEQHARAHSAHLTLNYEPHALSLTIHDDGVGLLDGTHERPGVHALRAISYRLAEIDGSLEVFDSDGVTVRGTIPLFEYSTPSRKE